MKMNTKTGSLILTTAIAAILGIVPMAHARSIIGQAAVGFAPSDRACVSISYDSVVNACSTTADFMFPIVADTTGNKTFTFTAYGATASNNVQCQAVGVDQDVLNFWASGFFALPQFGTPQNIVVSTYAPSGGGYYGQCDVGPDGSVAVINFTP